MNRIFPCVIKLAIALALIIGAPATAAGEEYYKNKIIHFIVGTAPGGGYDTYTRAVARHIGRHIPGNPTSIVQNMTGRETRVTAHYVYTRAQPDGLTLGVWNSGLVLRQALGDRSLKFKSDQFGWIGAPSKGYLTCAIMGFTGLRTLEDVLNSKKPIKMGGTGPGFAPVDFPRILNLTLGTKFNVISGYGGTPRIRFALQMREVDGTCFGWEGMRVVLRAVLDAKGDDKLIPFGSHGDAGDPEVKDLRRFSDVVKGEEKLAILNAYLLHHDFQRPLTLPPGSSRERLSILRKAFKSALEDPEFLAEAKRSNLTIDYVSGEEIEGFVDEILAISPETKAKLQFLLE